MGLVKSVLLDHGRQLTDYGRQLADHGGQLGEIRQTVAIIETSWTRRSTAVTWS